MPTRDPDLQTLVEALQQAFDQFAENPASRQSLAQIFTELDHPVAASDTDGARLPVCRFLDDVAVPEKFDDQTLRRLVETFRAIEPRLTWRRRDSTDSSASANIAEGHANAMILGPGGLELRRDVWIGLTLLGPHMRYPDHSHAPEETYLVMSEGEFCQGDGAWFRPGVGGSFYNVPNIRHAMRSQAEPLLAFWALRVEPSTVAGYA